MSRYDVKDNIFENADITATTIDGMKNISIDSLIVLIAELIRDDVEKISE